MPAPKPVNGSRRKETYESQTEKEIIQESDRPESARMDALYRPSVPQFPSQALGRSERIKTTGSYQSSRKF
jgi:hypothetical protein